MYRLLQITLTLILKLEIKVFFSIVIIFFSSLMTFVFSLPFNRPAESSPGIWILKYVVDILADTDSRKSAPTNHGPAEPSTI